MLNKVAAGSRMPFEWTVNPYRGCSHACVYCFARKTHTYLDFDAGLDFDSQVVVKINAAEVLRRELTKPSWQRHHVALGTNTDPYQRAEGRYQLMPGSSAPSQTPALPCPSSPRAHCWPATSRCSNTRRPGSVGVGISLAMTTSGSRGGGTGTPGPRARLKLVSRLREAGLPCGVMAMPILPWLSDSGRSAGFPLRLARRRRRHRCHRRGALPQARKPGNGSCSGSPKSTRSSPASTAVCTAADPTPRRNTGPGWPAGSVLQGPAWLPGLLGFSHRDLDGDPREEEAQYPAGSIPDPAAQRAFAGGTSTRDAASAASAAGAAHHTLF